MTCQVTGRPCCIQMQGQCRIATREYCNFVKGHFHENATLCSQVNCFSDICGMLPFVRKDYPDQFYRMLFSLFLHAGIIHVAFTVFVQMWLMVDLEMLIGWKRMAILYIGSGIGGNIASAIFVPYSVSDLFTAYIHTSRAARLTPGFPPSYDVARLRRAVLVPVRNLLNNSSHSPFTLEALHPQC
ncbi:unnamed protein product [Haemonchus placei]|uniref:Rhomboid domain-containing protein n=1 Tax=Haemonchus placei TaxID=6290 RepID=A0A0N4VVT9_HAEPC|nr:unnamed protein product [Haemonchus placei]